MLTQLFEEWLKEEKITYTGPQHFSELREFDFSVGKLWIIIIEDESKIKLRFWSNEYGHTSGKSALFHSSDPKCFDKIKNLIMIYEKETIK